MLGACIFPGEDYSTISSGSLLLVISPADEWLLFSFLNSLKDFIDVLS